MIVEKIYLEDKDECILFFKKNFKTYVESVDKLFLISKIIIKKKKPVGLVLRLNKKIVGFIGFLNSNIFFEKKKYNVLNLTDWFVLEEYRSHSLKLVLTLLSFKDSVLTCLSPTQSAQEIFLKLGFSILDKKELIFKTYFYCFDYFFRLCKITLNNIDKDSDDFRIISDHIKLGCKIITIEYKNEKVTFVVLKTLNNFHLIHISKLYFEHSNTIWKILLGFCFIKFGIRLLKGDSRMILTTVRPNRINNKNMFFYSRSKKDFQITRAYSEPLNKHANIKTP